MKIKAPFALAGGLFVLQFLMYNPKVVDLKFSIN